MLLSPTRTPSKWRISRQRQPHGRAGRPLWKCNTSLMSYKCHCNVAVNMKNNLINGAQRSGRFKYTLIKQPCQSSWFQTCDVLVVTRPLLNNALTVVYSQHFTNKKFFIYSTQNIDNLTTKSQNSLLWRKGCNKEEDSALLSENPWCWSDQRKEASSPPPTAQ